MATVIGNGLESFLHRQSRERALNLVAEANERAADLLKRTREGLESARAQAAERSARTANEERRRALAQAGLKAKHALARRQEDVLARVWAEAEARLRALDASERAALLERLVADAAAQLGGGPLEVHLSREDLESLNQSTLASWESSLVARGLECSLRLAAQPASIRGGAVVRRVDARTLVDNSLEARLALARTRLRDEVQAVLGSRPAP